MAPALLRRAAFPPRTAANRRVQIVPARSIRLQQHAEICPQTDRPALTGKAFAEHMLSTIRVELKPNGGQLLLARAHALDDGTTATGRHK